MSADHDSLERPRPNRRQFAASLAALGAFPLVAAADDHPAKERPDPVTAAADAMAELIRSRHGKHLTDEQFKQVKRRLQNTLRSGQALYRTKLNNGDEPSFVFRADVP
jgi:hypothetical protein